MARVASIKPLTDDEIASFKVGLARGAVKRGSIAHRAVLWIEQERNREPLPPPTLPQQSDLTDVLTEVIAQLHRGHNDSKVTAQQLRLSMEHCADRLTHLLGNSALFRDAP